MPAVQAKDAKDAVDDPSDIEKDLVHLARLALTGSTIEIPVMLRKLARRYRDSRPSVASSLVGMLRESPLRSSNGRAAALAQPVDQESRLPLIRHDETNSLPAIPILSNATQKKLDQLVQEYANPGPLYEAGLAPTRSALFTGPPGVGKTLSARWLAKQLAVPLLTLDLSSVMSSFLGRTGANVRRVLDYAKSTPSVLLIDELDAVAKRRDDVTELGELKRLVTVLLQEIDNWPEGSLLLAASNHSELLDPAIWRRFEMNLEFHLPEASEVRAALQQYLDGHHIKDDLFDVMTHVLLGSSFSYIEREVTQARRLSAIHRVPIEQTLLESARDNVSNLPTTQRISIAIRLMKDAKVSQRRTSELTGVSRDTLRKHQ